jgi:hypothetical protein
VILLLLAGAVLGLMAAGSSYPERRRPLWTAASVLALPMMFGLASLLGDECFWMQFWMRWDIGLYPDYASGYAWFPIAGVAGLGLLALRHKLWPAGNIFFAGLLVFCVWMRAVDIVRGGACSVEDGSLGSLAAVRSALDVYRGEYGGYPTSLSALTAGGKYLKALPRVRIYGHERSDRPVTEYPSMTPHDTGTLGYVSEPRDPNFGVVFIDCTHTHKDRPWNAY